MRRTPIPWNIRHRWPTAYFALGRHRKNHRLRVIHLRNVFGSNIARRKN
jgi:hypothetical protein